MEKLKELKETIENIKSSCDYDIYYTKLKNATIDYMNETKDWEFYSIFDNIIDYKIAEDIANHKLKNGGLIKLYYFLGDANINNDIFKIDDYGNLKDVDEDDLNDIKEQIIDLINEKLENEDQQ